MYLRSLVITGTTPNAPAGGTVIGSPIVFCQFLDAVESVDVNADLVGATGGVLNLYLQTSTDAGVTWYDYAAFAQLASGAAASTVRFGFTRGTALNTIVAVGKNLVAAPANALAAGTVVGGPFGDRMRLVAIAGASTTAGATITVRMLAASSLSIPFPQA